MKTLVSLLWLLAAASPAAAQAVDDPIGALLDRSAGPTPAAADPEEPDTAGQPVARPEPAPSFQRPRAQYPSSGTPSAPIPYASPAPQLTRPVDIMETGKAPDAPSLRDMAYESRLKSSFASAQGFQGPLDGGWLLSGNGGDLYSLQLVDRGKGVLEGAWRDLRQTGVSGFVDEIERTGGGELLLRFTPDTGGPATVTLRGGYTGRWTGDLAQNGRTQAVTLRRKPQ